MGHFEAMTYRLRVIPIVQVKKISPSCVVVVTKFKTRHGFECMVLVLMAVSWERDCLYNENVRHQGCV